MHHFILLDHVVTIFQYTFNVHLISVILLFRLKSWMMKISFYFDKIMTSKTKIIKIDEVLLHLFLVTSFVSCFSSCLSYLWSQTSCLALLWEILLGNLYYWLCAEWARSCYVFLSLSFIVRIIFFLCGWDYYYRRWSFSHLIRVFLGTWHPIVLKCWKKQHPKSRHGEMTYTLLHNYLFVNL